MLSFLMHHPCRYALSDGTFVFHTISGQTMCPHEENTDPIANPTIEIVESTRQTITPADESMVVRVQEIMSLCSCRTENV